MSKHSILELNSFLTGLMEGWNEEAAVAVVEVFHELPMSSVITTTVTETKKSTPLTGYTAETGNVTIPNDDSRVRVSSENEEEVRRVGHYKIKQLTVGNNDGLRMITWWDFWASDVTTRDPSQPPSIIFGVVYIKHELQPVALVRFDWVAVPLMSVLIRSLRRARWRDRLAILKCYLDSIFLPGVIMETHAFRAHRTVLFAKSPSVQAALV